VNRQRAQRLMRLAGIAALLAAGDAARELTEIYSPANPSNPVKLYGTNAEVSVDIKLVTFPNNAPRLSAPRPTKSPRRRSSPGAGSRSCASATPPRRRVRDPRCGGRRAGRRLQRDEGHAPPGAAGEGPASGRHARRAALVIWRQAGVSHAIAKAFGVDIPVGRPVGAVRLTGVL